MIYTMILRSKMINQSFQTMKLIIQSTSQQNDAEQPENISTADRVVNDQTDDDFADPVREENNANRVQIAFIIGLNQIQVRLSMLT